MCPVAALVNQVRINQVHQDVPLFSVRSANSMSPTCPITYAHYSSFLARVIKSVGLDSTCYSPQSFRYGGATFTFEAHVPSELIKAQGDWPSDCYFIYLEMSDRQRERPLLTWRPLFHKWPFSLVVPFFSLTFVSFLIILSPSTTYHHVWTFAVLFIDLSPASRSASQ